MKSYNPTVLIVDDDYYTVECLLTLIDWKEVGMVPVAHAYDGLTALQLMAEWQPDILITDISMPVMSGLELASSARQKREGLYIILLTAFEDFHYVKSGLEIGADAYLVKQLDYVAIAGELKSHVFKALEKRDARRRQAALQAAEDTLLEQLLTAWLRENDPVKLERLTSLDAFQTIMTAEAVSVMICDFSGAIADQKDLVKATHKVDEALKMVVDWLKCHGKGSPIFYPSSYAVGMLASSEICSLAQKRILQKNSELDLLKPLTAIGPALSAVQAPKSLLQAEQSINMKILGFDEDLTGLTCLVDSFQDSLVSSLSRFAKQLAECIRDSMDSVATINASEYVRLSKQLENKGWNNAVFLLRTCLTLLPQNHQFPLILSNALCLWEKDAELELRNVEVLAERLQQAVVYWLHPDKTEPTRQPGLQVKKLMGWVYQNLENDTSLQRASEAFLLTPNYIGKLFHKETGEYFSDYVLRMKLERSCEYLGQPSLRIYEIADRLGFRNLSYFHAKFHERYGCSPGNWRKQS